MCSESGKESLFNLTRRVVLESRTRSPLAGDFDPAKVKVEPLLLPEHMDGVEEKGPIGTRIRYPQSGYHKATIPGYEDVIKGLRRLAATPEINRLNHVKQLSTASISSAVGGGHSRLEHTLGAFDTAIRLLKCADDHMMKYSTVEMYRNYRQRIINAALTIAFFHDAFHPPYGHVLDPLLPVLLPKHGTGHYRIDKAALTVQFGLALEQKGLIYKLLQDSKVFSDEELPQVLDFAHQWLLLLPTTGTTLPDHSDIKDIGFIFDILSSGMDHDRIDYIMRDSSHAIMKIHDCEVLLDNANIVKYQGVWRLAFSSTAGDILRNAMNKRQQLYNHVYEARDKAPYDEMILHAVWFLLEKNGMTSSPFINNDERNRINEFGFDFVSLSDHDLFRVILEASDTPLFARILVQDVLTNAPFISVFHQEIDNNAIEVLVERERHLGKRFDEQVKEYINPSSYVLRPNPAGRKKSWESLKKLLRENVWINKKCDGDLTSYPYCELRVQPDGSVMLETPATGDDALFWLLYKLSNVTAKMKVEETLWNEVKEKWEEYPRWADELACKLVEYDAKRKHEGVVDPGEKYERAEKMVRMIGKTPLLFVYMARVPEAGAFGLLQKDRGVELRPLVYYVDGHPQSPNGEPFVDSVKVDSRKSINNFWLAVLKPPSMPTSVDSVVHRVMTEFIEEYRWFDIYANYVKPV